MTHEEYQRIMEAAKAGVRQKENMAEALALDIPHKKEGDGQNIEVALKEAHDQMIDAGYEDIPVGTLRNMRATAIWVEENRTTVVQFPWRRGSSFTAHQYAAGGGMQWAEFSKRPLKTRDVQKMLGNKVTSTSVNKKVSEMTAADKYEMTRALADDDIASVTQAIVTKQKENVTKALKKDPAPTHRNPSDSLGLTRQLENLRGVIAGNVRFTELITAGWTRELNELGGFVKDDQRKLIEADVNKAIAVYEGFMEGLNG